MKTTKRIFVLLCLMVVTMGAWADPTMKLTVKTTDKTPVTVIEAQSMETTDGGVHWSLSL